MRLTLYLLHHHCDALITHGDLRSAAAVAAEYLGLSRAKGDPWLQGYALELQTDIARAQGAYGRALALLEESRRHVAYTGEHGLAFWHARVSRVALALGDLAAAKAHAREALGAFTLRNSVAGRSDALETLALTAWLEGDLAAAEALCIPAPDLGRSGYGWETALLASAPMCRGLIACTRGDLVAARAWFLEGLRLAQARNVWAPLLACLDGLAGVAAAEGRPEEAVRLFTTTAAARGAQGAVRLPVLEAIYAADLAAARAALTPAAYDAAQAVGAALSPLQAAADVLEAARCWVLDSRATEAGA
jgi:hypothetical protein